MTLGKEIAFLDKNKKAFLAEGTQYYLATS